VAETVIIQPSDTIDLHHFKPKDIPELIDEFIASCHEEKIHSGKIIHGKGIGTLRSIVHSRLSSNKLVKDFRSGNEHSGGWGVTIFSLVSHATK